MFEFLAITLLHAITLTSTPSSSLTGNGGWGNDVAGPKPKTTLATSSTSTTTTTTTTTKPGTGNGGWGND